MCFLMMKIITKKIFLHILFSFCVEKCKAATLLHTPAVGGACNLYDWDALHTRPSWLRRHQLQIQTLKAELTGRVTCEQRESTGARRVRYTLQGSAISLACLECDHHQKKKKLKKMAKCNRGRSGSKAGGEWLSSVLCLASQLPNSEV